MDKHKVVIIYASVNGKKTQITAEVTTEVLEQLERSRREVQNLHRQDRRHKVLYIAT